MDHAHPLSTPMIFWFLDPKKYSFHTKEDNEETFGLEVSYLNSISALLYPAWCVGPDIASSMNLLARFSLVPTRRY